MHVLYIILFDIHYLLNYNSLYTRLMMMGTIENDIYYSNTSHVLTCIHTSLSNTGNQEQL